MSRVATLVFVFAALLRVGESTRCYICDSLSNEACADPIKQYSLELTECTPTVMKSSSEMLARALNGVRNLEQRTAVDLLHGAEGYYDPPQCQKIAYYFDGKKVVIRGCHTKTMTGPENRHCQVLKDRMYPQDDLYLDACMTCDRDGCNSAGTAFLGWTTALVMVVARLLR